VKQGDFGKKKEKNVVKSSIQRKLYRGGRKPFGERWALRGRVEPQKKAKGRKQQKIPQKNNFLGRRGIYSETSTTGPRSKRKTE